MPHTAQVDRFVHERLPPPGQWPELLLPGGDYADRPLNCVELLLDRHLAADHHGKVALADDQTRLGYGELHERVCRLANVLTRDFGVVPGNRVLLRSPNCPMLVALWLAVQKCGAVAVTTMALLRRTELGAMLEISRPTVAVCDAGLAGELEAAVNGTAADCRVVTFDGGGGELHARMARQRAEFDTVPTAADDVALIGFTSGTTGRPKATVHFHRDVLAVCETVGADVVRPRPDDVFVGTSPLAFTFGLGGLVLIPLYVGATSVLNPRYTPQSFLDAIDRHRATVCFTVPTFYQRMAPIAARRVSDSLRMAVSSGEALPLPVRDQWRETTGIELTEVIGATEMLHAFAGSSGDDVRPGYIGPAIRGYTVAVHDDAGEPLPPGEIGALAVKGPTGCRYLDDPRQKEYVRDGWNYTGDACTMDENGYIAYHARLDDMIVSAGYNISGAEVENVLLDHPEVAECAVIGTPDAERGQVVTAFVVARSGDPDKIDLESRLTEHVCARLAPYKYPRRITLLDALPRNESGKIQRYALREGGFNPATKAKPPV